jgi:CheY-like chemotaxis protein
MEVDGHAKRPFRNRDPGDVIDVRVGQQDVTDAQRLPLCEYQQLLDLVTGIDQHRLPCVLAANYEPVLEERSDRLSLDYHQFVILAVVDDLMFTSKIKTTAGQLGVPVVFARSSSAALDQMRKDPPSLVIFDLNSARTDPLGTVAAMGRDPGLAAIPTVGFVSHVQTDLIAAARQAGVGEVMARSAFTARLAEILRGA